MPEEAGLVLDEESVFDRLVKVQPKGLKEPDQKWLKRLHTSALSSSDTQ